MAWMIVGRRKKTMIRPENVAAIIPTAGKRIPLLKALCRHLTDKSVGQIIVMENSCGDFRVYEAALHGALVVSYPAPFNWSKINNCGAKYVYGTLLSLVSSTTTSKSSKTTGWIKS